MRKFLLCPLLAILSCLIIGCSSDFEELSNSGEIKMLEAKSKIYELASDYGLSINIDETILKAQIQELDFDSLEKQFKELANLKGIYKMEQNGANTSEMKQVDKIRTRSNLTRSIEKADYNFGETEIFLADGVYNCKCLVTWDWDCQTLEILNANAKGFITSGSSLGYSTTNITTVVNQLHGVIRFSGVVTYFPDNSCFISYVFGVSGWCNGSGGVIEWESPGSFTPLV